MSKVKLRFRQIIVIGLMWIFKILSLVFSKRKHWVISERGTDARDNGYHFYKYMKENHTDITVYYLIDKKSADYIKVKNDSIEYGSLKSLWLLASAKKIVSTHYGASIPYVGTKVFRACGLSRKFYFLQHGVIPNTLKALFYENAPMRLFVCGAKPEYDFIKKTFGHPERVVRYLGLARHDKLHNIETKNQILIMPTWRMYIKSREDFLQSKYYSFWQAILSDECLQKELEEKNYQLIFYPHYEMQKYLSNFNSNSKNIILASFENYDVQALLKESCLLITDYSSVFFDFAYMNKPVMYFHFDKEEFYGKHYEEGYFNYEQVGFGEVCHNVDQVVEKMIHKIKNDFVVEPLYKERMDSFFPLKDDKNCERIYNAIIEN